MSAIADDAGASRRTTEWSTTDAANRPMLGAVLVLATLHVVGSWGHLTAFWGDYGNWLHEVERVASGERLYSDVYWPQLPAAAWLLGAWGRTFGTNLVAMWSATVLLYYAGVVAFTWLVRATGPHEGGVLLMIAAAVLAWAFGNIESAPLPMGAYTPAALLGGVLLLATVVSAVGVVRYPTEGRPALLGFLLGAMVLTKIDFWPPAAAIAGSVLWFTRTGISQGAAARMLGSLGVTVSAGAMLLVAQSGLRVLTGVATGFGLARYGGSRSIPTPETVVLEATMTAGLVSVLLLLAYQVSRLRRTLRWGLACLILSIGFALAWVGANALFGEGVDLSAAGDGIAGLLWIVRRSRLMLQEQALRHALPLAFPFIALVIVVRQRDRIPHASRNTVVLLVATMIGARLRRGFHHTDWYHPLLEIPLYSMLLGLLWAQSANAVRRLRYSTGLAAMALAFAAYWNLGRGALTRRGWFPPMGTIRGAIHIPSGDATVYTGLSKTLSRVDPTGTRPLFAFGLQGGFAYFMSRRNPTLLTQGFLFTGLSTQEREWNRLATTAPPPLLLNNPFTEMNESPPGQPRRWGWKGRPFQPIFREIDRPLFNRIALTCGDPIDVTTGQRRFTLYDCPATSPDTERNGQRR